MPSRSSKSNPNEQNPENASHEEPQSLQREALFSIEQLTQLLGAVKNAGGLPFTLSQAPLVSIDTAARLTLIPPVSVVFPACGEALLSLIKTTDTDDLTIFFKEYFKFGQRHQILSGSLRGVVDDKLLSCNGVILLAAPQADDATNHLLECCYCSPCIIIDGNRNALPSTAKTATPPPPLPLADVHIKRLFLADLFWLFYFERMGIFKILGVILEDFATKGQIPISNGSLEADMKDDLIAIVLETMVQQIKTGLSSSIRDRDSSYRRCLGWTSDVGRKLGLDSVLNTSFTELFHKFIYNAIQFYTDRRLAVAIRGSASLATPPSVATLITIRDTITVLQKRFEVFDYGRNYTHTLAGIVWAIAGMTVVRELRTTLGIPPSYNAPHEYLPAAYDLLVLKRPVTQGESNRYLLHRDCAQTGRDLLLDMQVLKLDDPGFANPDGELEIWLNQVEAKVEGYRTAYRTLTGVDIGLSATPTIEHVA
jgi:hypothetical protein